INPAPTVALDRTSLAFGATTSGATFTAQTSGQAVRISQSGSGSFMWTAAPTVPWIVVTPASGTGPAVVTVTVQFAAGVPASGQASGTIGFTFTGAANTPDPVTVTLTTVANGA